MSDPLGDAVLFVSGCTITALALTEQFEELPAAVVAFFAAWWIVGLDARRQDHGTAGRDSDYGPGPAASARP